MRSRLLAPLAFLWLAVSACDCQSSVVLLEARNIGGGGLGDGGSQGLDSGTVVVCDPNDPSLPRCSGHVCACADCVDDDGDGRIDASDPECTGSQDDDESTYAFGFSVSPGKSCDDCYWDGDSGSGNDSCSVSTQCGIDGTAANGSCSTCTPTAACVSRCLAAVPNGCDCFGCCEVFDASGASHHVRLAATCTGAKLGDTGACPVCVSNPACENPCGRCELCAGKTLADLPADCGGHATCEAPSSACAIDGSCPTGFACSQGCCVATLF